MLPNNVHSITIWLQFVKGKRGDSRCIIKRHLLIASKFIIAKKLKITRFFYPNLLSTSLNRKNRWFSFLNFQWHYSSGASTVIEWITTLNRHSKDFSTACSLSKEMEIFVRQSSYSTFVKLMCYMSIRYQKLLLNVGTNQIWSN